MNIKDVADLAHGLFQGINDVLLFKVCGIPITVIWLLVACIFFTLRFNFINIRMLPHGFRVVFFNQKDKEEKWWHFFRNVKNTIRKKPIGDTTPFQALMTSISGTVGLGSIVGVSVGIQLGGPGVIFWMMITTILSMSLKFVEVTISHKYRKLDANNNVVAGPFAYIKEGLNSIGMKKSSIYVSIVFASIFMLVMICWGMFQANQAVSILSNRFDHPEIAQQFFSAIIAIAAFLVVVGGIETISRVSSVVVPTMAVGYILSCTTIIIYCIADLPQTISLIFHSAFSGPQVLGGSIIASISIGLQRAFFVSEVGLGSTSIEHASTSLTKSVDVGSVSLLESVLGTLIICLLTGLVVVITGSYQNDGISGILIANQAFNSISNNFSILLVFASVLFAFSTVITNSYHGERAWTYTFGSKLSIIYKSLFCLCVYLGCFFEDFKLILSTCDALYLMCTIPNVLVLYLLLDQFKEELYRK